MERAPEFGGSGGAVRGDRLALRQFDRHVSVWDPRGDGCSSEQMRTRLYGRMTPAATDVSAETSTCGMRSPADGRTRQRSRPRVRGRVGEPGGLPVTIAGQGMYFWNRPQVDRVLAAPAPWRCHSGAGDTVSPRQRSRFKFTTHIPGRRSPRLRRRLRSRRWRSRPTTSTSRSGRPKERSSCTRFRTLPVHL